MPLYPCVYPVSCSALMLVRTPLVRASSSGRSGTNEPRPNLRRRYRTRIPGRWCKRLPRNPWIEDPGRSNSPRSTPRHTQGRATRSRRLRFPERRRPPEPSAACRVESFVSSSADAAVATAACAMGSCLLMFGERQDPYTFGEELSIGSELIRASHRSCQRRLCRRRVRSRPIRRAKPRPLVHVCQSDGS